MLTEPKRISQATLDLIQEACNDNIDNVLSELGLDIDNMVGFRDELRCACPVHGGDNPTSFAYSTRFKQWRCYTRKCHEDRGNIFGLAMILLSKKEDKEVGFREAVAWLGKLNGIDLDVQSSEIDPDQAEIRSLVRNAKVKKRVNRPNQTNREGSDFKPFPVTLIDGKIEPSQYFLDKGLDEAILRKYNVGFCDTPGKPMYMRSYAPVLNEKGDTVVGVTGRTINEKCVYCPDYHIQGYGCPRDNPKVKGYPKWLHHGFMKSGVFYNYNFAEPYIRKSKTVVLTEGPKDTWWLEQHGAHNSLSIFGLDISDYHLRRLIDMGVLKIIVALDNDEPGIEACEKIDSFFSDYFTIVNMNNLLSYGDDIADVPSHRMHKEIVPFIKQAEIM